jgi:hypothetical protein
MVPPSKRASGEGEGTNPRKRSKNKKEKEPLKERTGKQSKISEIN